METLLILLPPVLDSPQTVRKMNIEFGSCLRLTATRVLVVEGVRSASLQRGDTVMG